MQPNRGDLGTKPLFQYRALGEARLGIEIAMLAKAKNKEVMGRHRANRNEPVL